MPRLSLWNPIKTNDFSFIDRIVGEHMYAGGTGVLVHRYLGIQGGINTPDGGAQPTSTPDDSEVFIQDLLFLENRDRKYDKTIYDLRGQYDIQDADAYDLTQFGLFLQSDTLFMNFHIESMVESLGRKLMPGDVLELPHLRDDLLLGQDDAVNRFYVVQEGARPSEGYDPMWWPHLWRVKLGPISDSQEYRDILGTGENQDDLRNFVSQYENDLKVNDAVLAQAENDVQFDPQYRDNAHLYFDPEVPDKPTLGFDYMGGGASPPNGELVSGSGDSFPTQGVNDCDYFLRTDFIPNRLFQKQGNVWKRISDDNTSAWAAADKVLTSFINNDDTTEYTDGERAQVKTNMSKVVRPKTDD